MVQPSDHLRLVIHAFEQHHLVAEYASSIGQQGQGCGGFGLALANGLIALSGSLLAQYQGFADVQMGIGMVVWGLASVIIGEALVGERLLGLTITGTIMGSVLFRLLVAVALRWGMNPNDLKLVTAFFVFLALIFPGILKKIKSKKAQVSNA